jgi:hypothetical protein
VDGSGDAGVAATLDAVVRTGTPAVDPEDRSDVAADGAKHVGIARRAVAQHGAHQGDPALSHIAAWPVYGSHLNSLLAISVVCN